MTDVATRAREAAQAARVKLHAYREHAESGAALITIEIPLGDVPEAVKAARPGDPFMLALVALDANAVEPKAIPVKSRGHRLNALAHTICEEPEFQRWAFERLADMTGNPQSAHNCEVSFFHGRALVLTVCGIANRGELTRNEAACDKFEALLDQFHRAHKRRYFYERERNEP